VEGGESSSELQSARSGLRDLLVRIALQDDRNPSGREPMYESAIRALTALRISPQERLKAFENLNLTRRAHPDFKDNGVLDWTQTIHEARVQAWLQDKPILVEYGYEGCGFCRRFVSATLKTYREKFGDLNSQVIGLAAECREDAPRYNEPTEMAIRHFNGGTEVQNLPFIAVVSPDLKHIETGTPQTTAEELSKMITKVNQARGTIR
jgi:hypothetical protein